MTSPADADVLLFDLDDTLLDSGPNAGAAWSEALSRTVAACPVEAARLVDALRAKATWFWSCPERHRRGRVRLIESGAEIVGLALRELGAEPSPGFAQELSRSYRELRDEGITLIEGALDCLERHRSAGRRLGLVTNGSGPAQRAKLERFDLAGWFEHVQIEGELGIGKPDERVFEHALARLGVSADRAWMIGDNLEWDVLAPKRAGLRAAWVSAGRALPGAQVPRPDLIVETVSDY